MKFIPEPPSKPGAYWWKYLPTSERCLVEVFKSQGSGALWCRMNGSSQGTPEVLKGLWSSRLVPVEEVSEAWREGRESGLRQPETLVSNWNESRSKRVVEGLE